MTIGDLIEIAVAVFASAGVLLVVAGLVSWVVAAGASLLMLSVVLMYLAQVWASTPLTSDPPEE